MLMEFTTRYGIVVLRLRHWPSTPWKKARGLLFLYPTNIRLTLRNTWQKESDSVIPFRYELTPRKRCFIESGLNAAS